MINDLFATKAQRIAAYRAVWTALGLFAVVMVGTWAVTDTSIFDKPVLAPAIIAALGALGFRGGVEGRIDKGTTTIKPDVK